MIAYTDMAYLTVHRTIALPLCRDTIFPYAAEGLPEAMTDVISSIVKFISTEPYLEKKRIKPKTLAFTSMREDEDGVGFLFKIGVTKETKPLDFLAEQLLLMMEEGEIKQKSIFTKIPVESDGELYMTIKYMNFEKREIAYFYAKPSNPNRVPIAPMPENVWDKKAFIEGLGLEWWTVLKAVAAQYFCSAPPNIKRLKNKEFMLRNRLLDFALQKANIYIIKIDMPSFESESQDESESQEVYIEGKGRAAKVLLRNKDMRIGIKYIDIINDADKIYISTGHLLDYCREGYRFLEHPFVLYDYYFKPDENIGIACYSGLDRAFLYDGIEVVGDTARLLLGRDIFLKVDRIVRRRKGRNKYLLRFIPFVDETKQVEGCEVILFPEWLPKFFFEKIRGKI